MRQENGLIRRPSRPMRSWKMRAMGLGPGWRDGTRKRLEHWNISLTSGVLEGVRLAGHLGPSPAWVILWAARRGANRRAFPRERSGCGVPHGTSRDADGCVVLTR